MLENVSKYPVYNEIIVIAEGTPPINGQNGKVEFHFDLKKEENLLSLRMEGWISEN